MGYNVTYKYHERAEKGYNTNDVKEFKRNIGEPFEEVPLEKLASTVMMQLARRDVWVIDCEIVELTQKKISFKETDGGVVIKGKKFTLDTMAKEIRCEDVDEEPVLHRAVAVAKPREALPAGKIPQRMEIYNPEADLLRAMGPVKGFTVGKKYPVFNEVVDPREAVSGRKLPMLYEVTDDTGKIRKVAANYFTPVTAGLGKAFDMPTKERDNLDWGGVQGTQAGIYAMPSLRR